MDVNNVFRGFPRLPEISIPSAVKKAVSAVSLVTMGAVNMACNAFSTGSDGNGPLPAYVDPDGGDAAQGQVSPDAAVDDGGAPADGASFSDGSVTVDGGFITCNPKGGLVAIPGNQKVNGGVYREALGKFLPAPNGFPNVAKYNDEPCSVTPVIDNPGIGDYVAMQEQEDKVSGFADLKVDLDPTVSITKQGYFCLPALTPALSLDEIASKMGESFSTATYNGTLLSTNMSCPARPPIYRFKIKPKP